MTHEEKIQHCLNHLESLGNTEKEAIELFVNLTHNATMRLPQRGWYKDDYCKLKRLEKNTAIVELKKLPFGEDILKEELKYC